MKTDGLDWDMVCTIGFLYMQNKKSRISRKNVHGIVGSAALK